MEKYAQYLNNPEYKFVSYSKNQHTLGGKVLTEYNGFEHDDPRPQNINQGIPISDTDTVEDKENSFDMKDGSKYIFSNSINMPDKKYTFAQGAKRIASKYKLRDGDAMAKTAQERELGQLSQKQEFVKEVMKTPAQRMQEQMQQQFDMGGDLNTLYDDGGRILHDGKTPGSTSTVFTGGINDYNFGFGQSRFNTELPMNPMLSKGFATVNDPLKSLQRGATPKYRKSMQRDNPTGYKPAYGIPMAGYTAQALSNLPAMFAKPAKVNFQRVTPETLDLSSQRDEMRRSRNLQLAMAQKQAGQMGNAGQAGAYANAATSGIMGNYGDNYNQSMLQQQTGNVGIKNQANAQNAQIQMQEQIARQQEADAIRSGKNQAISNMGSITAQAGKTYQQMGQEANMLDWLGTSNPDYTITYNDKGMPIITRKRSNKYGGKIGRKV